MADLISALTFSDLIGSIGTLIVTGAYLATQLRYLNSDDILFPVANLIGSILMAYSLVYAFNLASALMEAFWILISLTGIANYLRRNKA